MNNRNIIQRIIRKIRKTLRLNKTTQSPEQIRKKQAISIGKQLHLKQNGYIFTSTTQKPSFYLPLYKTDYIQQRILTEGTYYENDNLAFICKEWNNGAVSRNIAGGCILDIGANIGNHTLFFFFECGIKKAYCFEPIDSTFNILKHNIDINALTRNVTLVNSAVGEAKGTATMSFYDKTNIGSTQIALDKTGDIPVVSIDSMHIEDDVKLVKIDVEGFEKGVIDGCRETLSRCKPYIMIEIQPENFAYISDELSKLGYKHIQLTGINYLFFCQ